MNLKDKTIVIAEAPEQASELTAELKKFGADIFLFPTVEISPPTSFVGIDEAIRNLANYDWLIFSSVNAVDFFLQRLEAKSVDISELDYLRVCAMDEVTAHRLAMARIHLDVLPLEPNAEDTFRALQEYIGEDLTNLRFIMPQAEITDNFLSEKLREAGAKVEIIEVWRTILPKSIAIVKLKTLLAADSVDCIIFTSSSTIENFARFFDKTDLAEKLKNVKIACRDKNTAQAADKFGVKVDILPVVPNDAALAEAVNDFF